MILLDTNIVSEFMRQKPNANVIAWLNQQHSSQLFLSSISIAEIGYGLFLLPDGKRKKQLQSQFNKFTQKAFSQRILDFTEESAKVYAKVMGKSRQAGRPMSVPDGQIASIALTQGYILATRNIKDFDGCGVELFNPFK